MKKFGEFVVETDNTNDLTVERLSRYVGHVLHKGRHIATLQNCTSDTGGASETVVEKPWPDKNGSPGRSYADSIHPQHTHDRFLGIKTGEKKALISIAANIKAGKEY